MNELLEDVHLVQTHPLTRGGLFSFSQIEDLEDEMHERIFDRLSDLNEDLNEDVLEYFFREYYIDEKSFETIGYNIGVPKRTLSHWFDKYFGWQARELNVDITDTSKRLKSKSLAGNINGKQGYQRYRDITCSKVEELLVGKTSVEKPFPVKKYRKYKEPFSQSKIIFKHFDYPESIFDDIIIRYNKQGLGIQAISTIISTLLESLVSLLRVKIRSPKISKQTVRKRIRRYQK